MAAQHVIKDFVEKDLNLAECFALLSQTECF
jgi:hypothetical protein